MNFPLALVCALPMLLGLPEGAPDPGTGGAPFNRALSGVVLVKRQGVRAFQDVADAFSEHCRVNVPQVAIDDGPNALMRAREQIQSARVLVAVGQPAVDAVAGVRAHIVYALAPDPPTGALGTNSGARPESLFKALLHVRPKARRIGAVFSSRGAVRMNAARAAARALNLELVDLPVGSSAQAIRAIHAMVAPPVDGSPGHARQPALDALWIGADPQLVDTQVFLFLLEMQLRWQVPVLAATRQQVSFGALLTVDWSPEAVGRNVAKQVNHLLEDPEHLEPVLRDHPPEPPEVVVNIHAALRMGIPLSSLRLPGWKVVD